MSAIAFPAADAQGFTLMEMLVVLGITALIAGLGFPAVQQALASSRHRLALAQVETALTEARADAVRTGVPTSYRPPVATESAWRGAPAPRFPLPRPNVRFFPDGSATGGEVELDEAGKRTIWRVDPVDGQAERLP